MRSTDGEPKLECKSMVLTLHTLSDIPRDLVSLDPRREGVELVLFPTAKYYTMNTRFCKLDLPQQFVAFSPSSIVFKQNRLVLDFSSAPTPCGLSSTRSSSSQHTISGINNCNNGLSYPVTTESLATAGEESGAAGTASGNGRVPNHSDNPHDVAHMPHRGHVDAPDLSRDADLKDDGKSEQHTPSTPSSTSTSMSTNKILLRYPTRSDLKVIIEVLVAVRQRRHDSAAVHWVTPSWADRSIPGTVSTVAAADGELVRHKVVNRCVGLTVGRLSCTMALPYATEDLREVVSFAPTAITDAAERLCDDYERLRQLHAGATRVELSEIHSQRMARRRQFIAQLSGGDSEWALYRSLLLEVCPDFFIRRIRRVAALYPPTPQTSPWARADVETLAAQYAGRELDLIRRMCMELGPDLSVISPRSRYLCYTSVRQVGDDITAWIRENYAQLEKDILDYEPDLFMESLALHYGMPEPVPLQCVFPAITYELDRRSYFCDTLRFPVNREHHRYRDEALAARQRRVPLQLTPCERPLQPARPTARNVGEIDILLEKYKPEFVQLVPSIADAMECVTKQNECLLRELLHENSSSGGAATVSLSSRGRLRALPYEVCPQGFDIFQSERPSGSFVALLTRFAEYTYISASTLLAAVIYLDRLCLRHPRLLLTARNIEKLLVTAVRVASKVIDLRSINNKNFAAVFSVSVQDMNDLEAEFLTLMNFDFFLSPKEFNNYAHLIQLPSAYLQIPTNARLFHTGAATTNANTHHIVIGGAGVVSCPTESFTERNAGDEAGWGTSGGVRHTIANHNHHSTNNTVSLNEPMPGTSAQIPTASGLRPPQTLPHAGASRLSGSANGGGGSTAGHISTAGGVGGGGTCRGSAVAVASGYVGGSSGKVSSPDYATGTRMLNMP